MAEEEMEKLGVEEDDDLKKEAQDGDENATCPVCGKAAKRHGTVLVCPDHGSEPFERK